MSELNSNIMIRLMADTGNYTTRMQAASKQAEQLATSLDKPVDKSQRLGQAATSLGIGIGALSLAIGVTAVQSFMEFDQAMSRVEADTHATGDSLTALRDKAIEAGSRTVYSATESADAIDELAKAGMSVQNILNGGLDGALDLAAAGNMDVAKAAEIAASALGQFGLDGSQASHVADLLAAGANTAQGDVSDMGEALNMVGTTASQMGMSIEDTIGALTALASKGITGSAAGEQLRSALIGLSSASGPCREQMQELGISLYDSQGNFVGLANFAGQLKTALSKLTPEQRANAMGILFSNAAMNAGNILYEEGAEGIEAYTDQVNQSGFAQQQAAKLTDNLKGDVEQLGGAFESAFIKIGSGANGPLRATVQTITDLVNAFADLPDGVQQAIILAGLGVGAFAGLHKVMGPLAQSTSSVGRGLSLALDPMQRIQGLASGVQGAFEMMRLSTKTYETQLSATGTAASRTELKLGALKSVGGGIIDLLGGPWGIAIGVAGAALMAFSKKSAEAQQRAESLQTALETTGDASEQIINNLSNAKIDNSWLIPDGIEQAYYGYETLADLLDDVGIKMSDMALAAQGNEEAMKRVTAVTDEMTEKGGKQRELAGIILSQLNEEKDNYNEAADAIDKKNQALDEVEQATQGAADGMDNAADSAQGLKDQTGELNDELDEFIDNMFSIAGSNLSADQAVTNLNQKILDLTQTVSENGKVLDENGNALAGNEQKAYDVQSSLQELASSAQNAASKIFEQGQATGDMATATEEAKTQLENARNAFIAQAQAAGYSEEQAKALADQYGLTSAALDQIPTAHDTTLTVTDQATETFSNFKLQVETTPDGKNFTISGDNQQAMDAIAAVTGATIDPKTGTLTLDKNQYDIALAIANGATIDEKTGQLLGDNSDMWAKVAQANGWTIDKKTGVISGDDGPFKVTKQEVESIKIGKKTVTVDADTGGFWGAVNSILGSVFNVKVGASAGHAMGGYITGPGTGTSDSIPAWLSNGEYVINARAVKALGRGFFDRINYHRYASGGYVQATPVPVVRETGVTLPVPGMGEVVDELRRFETMIGPIISQYAPRIGQRDLWRESRKAMQRGQ